MIYSKKVMKHFLNPKHFGEIKNATVIGKAGNPVCGDVMYVYLVIKNNKITKASFRTLGCVAAIAASDALCDLIIGKTIKEAEKISSKDIIKHLGTLPPVKVHCSVLGTEALRDALKKYKEK